jgi:hypothetical protein
MSGYNSGKHSSEISGNMLGYSSCSDSGEASGNSGKVPGSNSGKESGTVLDKGSGKNSGKEAGQDKTCNTGRFLCFEVNPRLGLTCNTHFYRNKILPT